jgi:PD-(D/E)XK endonuclease
LRLFSTYPDFIFMTNKGIDIQHPKLRGEWAELRFMARASEHGLRVSKPFGDCASYDVAVEHNGHFLRVQVKSTKFSKNDGRSYVCDLRRRESKPYTPDRVDFFAVYVIPRDLWYILPAEAAIGSQSNLTLSPDLPDSKHAPYKEAWHLLCSKPTPPDSDSSATEPAASSAGERSAPSSAHPDASLEPSHPLHHAEARMLGLRDRLLANPYLNRHRR